jgi:hypothetical protein
MALMKRPVGGVHTVSSLTIGTHDHQGQVLSVLLDSRLQKVGGLIASTTVEAVQCRIGTRVIVLTGQPYLEDVLSLQTFSPEGDIEKGHVLSSSDLSVFGLGTSS